jgi:hypothetical protein
MQHNTVKNAPQTEARSTDPPASSRYEAMLIAPVWRRTTQHQRRTEVLLRTLMSTRIRDVVCEASLGAAEGDIDFDAAAQVFARFERMTGPQKEALWLTALDGRTIADAVEAISDPLVQSEMALRERRRVAHGYSIELAEHLARSSDRRPLPPMLAAYRRAVESLHDGCRPDCLTIVASVPRHDSDHRNYLFGRVRAATMIAGT